MEVILSWIKSDSRITTTAINTTTATSISTSTISNPYFLLPYSTPTITYLTPIATITLHLHYHNPTPISTTTTTVTEVTFLASHNNNWNWPNTSTHVGCWCRHECYQLPLNLTTQNPSVLSTNSTFHLYFIYFTVRKANLKLVLSWFYGFTIIIYIQSKWVSYLAKNCSKT